MKVADKVTFSIHCTPEAKCCIGWRNLGADHHGDRSSFPQCLFVEDATLSGPSRTSQLYKSEPFLILPKNIGGIDVGILGIRLKVNMVKFAKNSSDEE